MGRRRNWSLLTAAAGVVIAVFPGTAPSALAGSSPTATHSDAPPSYVPLRGAAHDNAPPDRILQNVDYNGGPVMPSNTNYMVFWSPSGLGAYGRAPRRVRHGARAVFTDLAHDSGGHQNVDSVSTQYNDLTGAFARYASTFGGRGARHRPVPGEQVPGERTGDQVPDRPPDPGRSSTISSPPTTSRPT